MPVWGKQRKLPDKLTRPSTANPRGNAPDLASAATELGITEESLRASLGAPSPNLASAAAELGITEETLQAALDFPTGGLPTANGQP